MTAKVYSGRDGRLFIDGAEQIKVLNWSLTGNLNMLETTTLGDFQRTFIPGVQEFTGNASLLYYNDGSDANAGAGRNDAAEALKKLLRIGGVGRAMTVDMRLRLINGNVNSDVRLTTYVTSINFGASVGEVSRAEITFQGTGALLEVTL
jgi:hypothetical protein